LLLGGKVCILIGSAQNRRRSVRVDGSSVRLISCQQEGPMADTITLSVIKADIGGYVGHSSSHPQILERAVERLEEARRGDIIVDFHVTRCGDDLELIMTHHKGLEHKEIHELAWNIFVECTDEAKRLKLYGAGQDLLSDAFSGNVKGMGPGVAEMEFVERRSEPIVIFMADKTSPGAWSMPMFRMFADPFNSAGLVIDPSMHDGFTFEVLDIRENKVIDLSCPEEMYDLLAFIGSVSRFMIRAIRRKSDGEIAASASTDRLSLIAGKYVGKDDPVLIVRCQSGMPAVGEALEPFAFPHLVEGFMRGSHQGPLMAVPFDQANPSRFDGPPRVIGALTWHGRRRTKSPTTCAATGHSIPIGSPWRRWSIPLCPSS